MDLLFSMVICFIKRWFKIGSFIFVEVAGGCLLRELLSARFDPGTLFLTERERGSAK